MFFPPTTSAHRKRNYFIAVRYLSIQYSKIINSIYFLFLILVNGNSTNYFVYNKMFLKKIAVCWTLPVLVLIPSFFGIYGKHGLECYSRICTVIDDEHGRNPKMILQGLGLIAPIVILTIADASILWKMRVSDIFMSLWSLYYYLSTNQFSIHRTYIFAFRRYPRKLQGQVRRWVWNSLIRRKILTMNSTLQWKVGTITYSQHSFLKRNIKMLSIS